MMVTWYSNETFDGKVERVEHVLSNVTTVEVREEKEKALIFTEVNGKTDHFEMDKEEHRIIHAYLLNDDFKTLRKIL